MLLILRHTISSLVPRQSRPLQNVNTTSVTTSNFGYLCPGASQARCWLPCHGAPSQQRLPCAILYGKFSSSLFEPAGTTHRGFANLSRSFEQTVRRVHAFFPRAPSLYRHIGELHDRRMWFRCSPRACVLVRPEDNLESFPRQLAHAHANAHTRTRTGPGRGNDFRTPRRHVVPVRRLPASCLRPPCAAGVPLCLPLPAPPRPFSFPWIGCVVHSRPGACSGAALLCDLAGRPDFSIFP